MGIREQSRSFSKLDACLLSIGRRENTTPPGTVRTHRKLSPLCKSGYGSWKLNLPPLVACSRPEQSNGFIKLRSGQTQNCSVLSLAGPDSLSRTSSTARTFIVELIVDPAVRYVRMWSLVVQGEALRALLPTCTPSCQIFP